MDVRSPETLALAGVLFATVAISASDYKQFGAKPEATVDAASANACTMLRKSEVSRLMGETVVGALPLPGLGGPDCYYTLAPRRLDLLVRWSPGVWSKQSAADQKLGAVELDAVGAPAVWIPSQSALEAQAPGGRILYVAVWSPPGAPRPPDGQQLAIKLAHAALAHAAALAHGAGPQ